MPRSSTINASGNIEWTEKATSPDGDNLIISLELDAVDSGSGFVKKNKDSSTVSWLNFSISSNINSDGSRDFISTVEVDPDEISTGNTYRFRIAADDGVNTETRLLELDVVSATLSAHRIGTQSGTDQISLFKKDGTKVGDASLNEPKRIDSAEGYVVAVGQNEISKYDENAIKTDQNNNITIQNIDDVVLVQLKNGEIFLADAANKWWIFNNDLTVKMSTTSPPVTVEATRKDGGNTVPWSDSQILLTYDSDDNQRVTLIDNTLSIVDQQDTSALFSSSFFIPKGITTHKDSVYLSSRDYHFLELDSNLNKLSEGSIQDYDSSERLTSNGEALFVGERDNMAKVNSSNFSEVWRTTNAGGSQLRGTESGELFSTSDNNLYEIDPSDGTIKTNLASVGYPNKLGIILQ